MDGDWNWAVEQAKKGKKVRRIGWLPNMFMKAKSNKRFGLFLQAGDKEVDLGLGDNFMHTVRLGALRRLLRATPEITDWELFERN